MKQLDKLLITSFLPPFIVTFFIAIFVLMMQTLWLYIDDIAGKGAGLLIIMEFLGYLSVSLIPMALPIAVLISAVMVLGNLAEQYELSSFKSAGVPLLRVMLPLMFVTLGISVLSFFCSNNFIPVSNLKFKSRLYDMRKQKPTLSLEEGIFNDDFQGFAIRIGEKSEDERSIKDILMYDHSESNKGKLTEVLAASGEMYASDDNRFFVMALNDGVQYAEGDSKKSGQKKSYPFIRTSFKEWNKTFDLSEFEIDRTDEKLFESHHSMLSGRQLLNAIDSIDSKIASRTQNLEDGVGNYYYFIQQEIRARNKAEVAKKKAENKRKQEELKKKMQKKSPSKKDTAKENVTDWKKLKNRSSKISPNPSISAKKNTTSPVKKTKNKPSSKTKSTISSSKKQSQKQKNKKKEQQKKAMEKIKKQTIDQPLSAYTSIIETFPKIERKKMLDKAKSLARSIEGQGESAMRTMDRTRESRVKHVYTYHNKFSMALACFIFLFVGAPMGAIVRKGGFGFPILIAIFFFMLFVVLTIFCKKVSETFVLDAILAAWMPCMVIFPLGLFLTYKAMNDAKVVNTDKYLTFFNNGYNSFVRRMDRLEKRAYQLIDYFKKK